jgi:hypothetical protein
MQTPTFQQLDGLLVFSKAALRDDKQLVGTEVGQYGYKPDQTCHAIYPHKLFEPTPDGIAQWVPFGKSNLAALAIYIDDAEPRDVDGSSSGKTYPVGFELDLGVQYVFQARSRDAVSQSFAAHFAWTIWYTLCQRLMRDMGLPDDETVLRGSQVNIAYLELGNYKLLPPFQESIRAFEADMKIGLKRPPWMTGEPSDLVVPLESIYADINEVGPAGASPLIQLKYEVTTS